MLIRTKAYYGIWMYVLVYTSEHHLKHRRYDACWCLLAISISAKHIAGMSFYLWNAFYFWLLLSWIHTHTHKFPPRTLLFPLIHLAQEREKTEYASMAFKYFLSIVKCDAFTVECTQRIKTLYREIDRTHTQHIAAHQVSSLFPVGLSLKFSYVWTNEQTFIILLALSLARSLAATFYLTVSYSLSMAVCFSNSKLANKCSITHQCAILFRIPQNCS